MTIESQYGVIIVGAGNAAFSAAVSAVESGASVVVLEKAPEEWRGGNTYFTGDLRFPWKSADDLIPLIPDLSETEIQNMREQAKPYPQATFFDDVMRVTEGRSDPDLLQVLVTEAYPTVQWMASHGHTWTPTYARPGASMAAYLNGGGAQLSDHWFALAEKMGVDIKYSHHVVDLKRDAAGRIIGVCAQTPEGTADIYGKSVILACGGFEANAAMRASYLGKNWDLVKVRGVPYNTGDGLQMALDLGAAPYGHWSGCHATPNDLNHPDYAVRGGRPADPDRYAYPFGIMVNQQGRRFVDEGADLRSYTYAKTGSAILAQPGGVAFQIFDHKCKDLLHAYGTASGSQADSLPELAQMIGVDPKGLVQTIEEYNPTVQPGDFNPLARDGKSTKDLAIPKSNWARTIDEPPFYGYPVICAITFTFGGLRINTSAEVMHAADSPIPGLYACGEIVGGLYYYNYCGGSGMTSGSVFGRIAGREAAQRALA